MVGRKRRDHQPVSTDYIGGEENVMHRRAGTKITEYACTATERRWIVTHRRAGMAALRCVNVRHRPAGTRDAAVETAEARAGDEHWHERSQQWVELCCKALHTAPKT